MNKKLTAIDIFQFITIDPESRKPKYLQIVDAIKQGIANGNLKMGQRIPSINILSNDFLLSRDTVEKAFNILKQQRLITTVKGKGVYIAQTNLDQKHRILFLINKFSTYKMMIYNAFIEDMITQADVDLHIYHYDVKLFTALLNKYVDQYDYYVIMPHFKIKEGMHISYTKETTQAISKIPINKLIILDNNKLDILNNNGNGITVIFQEFDNDIYEALDKSLHIIKQYKKIVLAYPRTDFYPYPRRILNGFKKFCFANNLKYEVLEKIYEDISLKKGDLFITISESDLINLLREIKKKKIQVGEQIGIISYNDTPLKEFMGISVLTTDFIAMGKTAAQMILKKEKNSIKNPFMFKIRESIKNK